MIDWKYAIKIKDVLNRDDLTITEMGNEIVNRLKQYEFFNDFEYINDFRLVKTIDKFNNLLDLLYDYADLNRIWIE